MDSHLLPFPSMYCRPTPAAHMVAFHISPYLPIFARDSIYAIARICYRPSVCLSITRVDQSKTVEVRIMQLSSLSSPMTLVSSWLIAPRNSKGDSK